MPYPSSPRLCSRGPDGPPALCPEAPFVLSPCRRQRSLPDRGAPGDPPPELLPGLLLSAHMRERGAQGEAKGNVVRIPVDSRPVPFGGSPVLAQGRQLICLLHQVRDCGRVTRLDGRGPSTTKHEEDEDQGDPDRGSHKHQWA